VFAERFASFDFPAAGLAESLGCGSVGLYLWQLIILRLLFSLDTIL